MPWDGRIPVLTQLEKINKFIINFCLWRSTLCQYRKSSLLRMKRAAATNLAAMPANRRAMTATLSQLPARKRRRQQKRHRPKAKRNRSPNLKSRRPRRRRKIRRLQRKSSRWRRHAAVSAQWPSQSAIQVRFYICHIRCRCHFLVCALRFALFGHRNNLVIRHVALILGIGTLRAIGRPAHCKWQRQRIWQI